MPRARFLLPVAVVVCLLLLTSAIAQSSTVEGHVTSVTDGHAITGAKVTLGTASTLSDSSGNFSFSNVAGGGYTLTGSAAGFLSRSYSVNVVAGATVTQNVQLSVAGVLAGAVTNSSGIGIAGATVQYSGGVLNQSTTIAADSTGHFRTGWIPVGMYTVSVSAAGLQPNTASATINAGLTTTVNVQLASSGGTGPGSVTGRVTSVTDGTVISGATLTLGSASTTSDSSGNFAFSNVAAGSYALTAKANGFLARSYTVNVASGAATTQNVQLSVAGMLAGNVSGNAGGIAGATVQYSGGALNQTASVLTDVNGNYNTGWIPVGSYALTVSAANFATNSASATVNVGLTTTVNVSLSASGGGTGPGSVSGTVTSVQDGHAVSGAQLSLGSAITTSDTTGHYTFSNVASGTYTLNAVASGFLSRSYTVAVSGNAVTQNVQLSVAGILQGTVTNSSGTAVAGASVQIVGGALGQTFTLTTASTGGYNSGWIPIGTYTVTASASGITGSTTATVNTGQTTTANVSLGGSGGGTGGGGGSITCTPPSNGAIVCNPTNNATVTSPIHWVAAANSPNGMGDIWTYIDSTLVNQAHNVTKVDIQLAVPIGSHVVRIQAWDKIGTLFKAGVTLNIVAGGSGGLINPTRAVVTYGTTQQFTSNTAVTWSVDGVTGGNATVGTISASGLYTPPQAVGQHTVTAASQANPATTASAALWVTNSDPILTHKFNTYRNGQNAKETVLTLSNVNSSTFGKRFSYPVDGFTYAQPLYVPNLSIAGGTHNVVFVATEHDSVYAFDADGKQGSPLWHTSFINPAAGVTTFPQPSSSGTAPEIGVTSTPVIDLSTGTIYVVGDTQVNGTGARYQLHALDIHTGAEKFGGPVTISGSVAGTGVASSGGTLTFDPVQHLQRTSLLLANGAIYIAFASYGDFDPYHGWIFTYSASTLGRLGVFCDTPNGTEGGIWMAGAAFAADSSNNVYTSTGNGTFTVQNGGNDYGDSVIKFSSSPSLNVVDWFSPFNNSFLNNSDLDLGSGGPLLLPDGTGGANLLVVGGKSGALYVINRDNMGHWQSTSDSQIVQSIQNASPGEIMSTPVWWNGWVYVGALNDNIKAFQLQSGKLTVTPTSATATFFPEPGTPAPSVSANGSSNGILWGLEYSKTASEVLHAWDATNLTRELYNSTQAGSRDVLGAGIKFTVPVVADGKVFVGTTNSLTVYGLLP